MADLNIGNSTANVIVNAKHNGAVNPQINNRYDLGTSALRWKNIYASQVSDWYEISKNNTGEGTIVWNRILLLTTSQGDNPENDSAIEFELDGDQNYTFARHGYLFINSYGSTSRSLVLSSSGNGCNVYATLVPASATAAGNTYVWLGLGGSFTGKARMRILYNGSKNIVYTSSADRSPTSTAPNTKYITNDGNLKAGFNSTNNTWSYTLGVNSANGNAHTVDGEHSSAFVHIAGAETVTGTKTFTGNINIAAGAAGGLINGSATNGGLNSIRIGDDVWLGDINQGGILGLKADNSSTTQNGFSFHNGAGTNIGKLYADGTNLVTNKSFVPESDLSNNLGTTSKEFKELYVRAIAARHLDADRVVSSDHDLYIGYGSLSATNNTKFYYSADNADGVRSRIEYARINNNGLYALTRFGVNGQNTGYNFYVNGTSYQSDIACFVKTGTAAVFGGTLSNINSAIYAPTSGIQLCANSGGTTNSTAIGFHNPGISSSVFGYYQIDENNGQFRMRSDDTCWDLSLGGTIKLASSWGKANLVVGENGYDKIVTGYLVGNTNGAVIGAHNSALTTWAPLNISGSTINFREGETIRGKILDGCLSLFPSNSNYREGIRIHSTNFDNDSWSDILLCGADNNGDSGRSANSWFLGNNNGNFYITRNGSTSSTASYASVENNYWQFYPKLGINGTNTNYNFYVNGTSYFNDNIYLSGDKTIYQNQRNDSNYTTIITWLKGATTQKDTNGNAYSYQPQIGQHNTGGTNSLGSICILPYATSSDPWNGNVGLFITKNKLMLDNCRIPTTGNTSGTIGSASQPVYINNGIVTSIDWHIGNSGIGEHNANNVTYNFCGYYTSNGPATSIGASTTDGSLWAQAYSSAWVTQIAQDYRNGSLYVRSKNNGTWQSWYSVLDARNCTGILDGRYIKKSGDTTTGPITNNSNGGNWIGGRSKAIIRSTTCNEPAGYTWHAIVSTKSTNGSFELGCLSGEDVLRIEYTSDANYNAGNNSTTNCGRFSNRGVFYGAAWNDYAEYRETHHEIEPGRCVIEVGDGSLTLAFGRLQPGANIVSDTFGFAIGETETNKTPLAVSGRVLAYPNEPRESYYPGDPVCSGPNGTISRMTREEVREWPDRIVGTVSEIPSYETWGTGNVEVNGRIWIKVK